MTDTRYRRVTRRAAAVGVAALLLAGGGGVQAATIDIAVDGGLLTLEALDAPLEDVLRAIAAQADFDVVIKGDLSTPVTWSLADIPVADAVARLLQTRNYVMRVAAGRVIELRMAGVGGGVRVLPARSLRSGGVPDDRGLGPLAMTRALTDEDPSVRRRAIQDLDGNRDVGAVRALGEALVNDRDPENRRLAAVALGGVGGAAALDVMRRAAPDPDPDVREAMLESLAQLMR